MVNRMGADMHSLQVETVNCRCLVTFCGLAASSENVTTIFNLKGTSVSLRLIDTLIGPTRTVKVYNNSEYNEYVCRLFEGAKEFKGAAYHTNDKDDALSTAKIMANPKVKQ